MSRLSGRSAARLGFTSALLSLLGLVWVSGASAEATIGQLAPGTGPTNTCLAPQDTNTEYLQPVVVGGPSYAVPPGDGGVITSWSTNKGPGAGQTLKLKVWRKVGDPANYQVVGHDGPRDIGPGTIKTFQTSIPVQSGDLIGMTVVLNSTDTACLFDSPGNGVITPDFYGDFNDGQTAVFNAADPYTDSRLNLSATVALKASNDFEISKVKKNKNKGTATITVDVPGPGQLSLGGAGVKTQRAGGATISKDVTAAGKATLKVKAKGSKKKKLLNKGKVKVKTKITFTPSQGSADLPGDPNTETKKVKLVDNG